MSLRSSFIVPLVAGGFLAAPAAAADRLLVAGPDGVVMQADTVAGDFTKLADQCGSVVALAADAERIYAADSFGLLTVLDASSGTPEGVFAPCAGAINALAAADGAVFAGTESGFVMRIDPSTGFVVDTRAAPAAVSAMLAHGQFLFIASGSAIYRAPVAGGDFEYFSCFCFFNVVGLAWDRGDLVIADQNGIVARANGQAGELVTAFWVGSTNVMAASRGQLLLYYDGGAIPLVDAMTGASTGMLQSPIQVGAMLVIPERERTPRFEGKGPQRP